MILDENGAERQDGDLLGELREKFAKKKVVKKARKEKVVKKTHYRSIIGFLLVLFSLLSIGVVYAGERYTDWRAGHQWQKPIQWVGFVREVEKKVGTGNTQTTETEQKKVLTDMEVIEQYKLSAVLKSMYMLESTQGKSDGCKEKGEFNGYGYRQNDKEWKCYKSFEQVTELVNEWLEDNLQEFNGDLGKVLCHYNLGSVNGVVPNKCTYQENFMRVLVDNL